MSANGDAPRRHYYRCTVCLSVFCTEGTLTPGPDGWPHCGACDSSALEFLGRVARGTGKTLVHDVVPCDSRCTNARGPFCDCGCLGKNHGSMMLVERAAGDVPRLTPPRDLDAARTRATEWRAARASALARIEASVDARTLRRFHAREWIDRAAWETLYWAFKGLRAADKAKTHAGRMKMATDLLAPVEGAS